MDAERYGRALKRLVLDKNYRIRLLAFLGFFNFLPDEKFLKLLYKANTGEELNLENPVKLNEKLTHVGKRTTRDKILSYLSAEAGKSGSDSFDIPYNRQQLADYLYVDRCGLSTELSKLQNENLIRFNKNHFKLLL